MKKLYSLSLSLILVGLFVLPIISAFEFDNVKNYDSENKTVDIRNSILGIPFLQLSKIVELKLVSPQTVYVTPEPDQRIAEIEVTSFVDSYENEGFNKLSFYNMRSGLTEINRNFRYKYRTVSGQVEVDDYKWTCEELGNSSIRCYDKKVGSHNVDVYDWVEFSDYNQLPKGQKNIVGIYVDVNKGDYVEWIPEFFGVRIEEWAAFAGASKYEFHPGEDGSSGLQSNLNQSQTFRVGTNGTNETFTLSGFSLESSSTNIPVIIESCLYSTNGSTPTTSLTCNTTINGTELVNGEGFNISMTAYNLTKGRMYAMVLRTEHPDPIEFKIDSGSLYEGGSAWDTGGSGGIWKIIGGGGYDFKFEVWGIALPADTQFPDITLDHPQNISYNFNNISLNVSSTADDIESWVWSNDSFTNNRSFAGMSNTSVNWSEGQHTLHVGLNDTTGNFNFTSVTFVVNTTQPTITIDSPQNKSYSVSTINLNVSSDDAIQSWLWNNGTDNRTFTPNVSVVWEDGQHLLTVWGNDSSGVWGTNTVTFIVDTSTPGINLTYPENNSILWTNYSTINSVGVEINWTISGGSYETCRYFNQTANVSVTCGDNSSIFNLTFGRYRHIVYVNDTSGNENESSVTVTYDFRLFENSTAYNTSTYETSHEGFNLQLTWNNTIYDSITSYFWYNGTRYIPSSDISGRSASFTNGIDIPFETGSKSFNWEIILSNTSGNDYFNTSTFSQTVNPLVLGRCNSSSNITVFNFSLYTERNRTRLFDWIFKGTFNFYNGEGDLVKNISIDNSTSLVSSEMLICIQNATSYFVDAVIEYDKNDSYVNRFYYFDNEEVNTTLVRNISLFTLQESYSTSFIVHVKDKEQRDVKDAFVYSDRYYPEAGVYETVQIAKTGEDGKSISFFESEDALYRFRILRNGETELTTPRQNVFPEDSPYTITFIIGVGIEVPWIDFEPKDDLTYTLSFNNFTNITTFTWTDTSSGFSQARLKIVKEYHNQSDEIICNSTSTESSGSITCDVTGYTGTLRAEVYITRSGTETIIEITLFVIRTARDIMGNTGMMISLFIILTAGFAFIWHPIAGIIGINSAVIFVNLIGLVSFPPIFLFAMIAISIILIFTIKS